jgi:hypothetical protein
MLFGMLLRLRLCYQEKLNDMKISRAKKRIHQPGKCQNKIKNLPGAYCQQAPV